MSIPFVLIVYGATVLVKKLGSVGRDAGHEELTTNQVEAIPIRQGHCHLVTDRQMQDWQVIAP